MMQFVPGDDPGQRAHAEFILIRDARPHPRVRLKMAKQQHGGPPHRLEFFD
jgi:hypothetical protein